MPATESSAFWGALPHAVNRPIPQAQAIRLSYPLLAQLYDPSDDPTLYLVSDRCFPGDYAA
jgi:hypothetical protein